MEPAGSKMSGEMRARQSVQFHPMHFRPQLFGATDDPKPKLISACHYAFAPCTWRVSAP